MHAYGGAIDHDPARNPLGADPKTTFYGGTEEGAKVVAIFKRHGWTWGGDFKGRKDAMPAFCIPTGERGYRVSLRGLEAFMARGRRG